jgi:hypothetical protein
MMVAYSVSTHPTLGGVSYMRGSATVARHQIKKTIKQNKNITIYAYIAGLSRKGVLN